VRIEEENRTKCEGRMEWKRQEEEEEEEENNMESEGRGGEQEDSIK